MDNNDSRYEHLDLDHKGDIKGVWSLDPRKAKGVGTHDFWGKLEQLIEEYTQLHPKEILECLEYCKRKREMAFNPYGLNGEDKESSMRMGIGIPNGLLIKILVLDPEFLNVGGRLNKFRKLYPGFNTSKRV